MKIVLKDVFDNERISGNYESLVDCIVKNKGNLSYIDFSDKDFREEDFRDVDLKYFYLRNSNFNNANFEGVDFSNIDLSCISLSGVNFFGANFSNVKFCGTNFYGVNFEGSNFSCANFKDVDFSNACFKWSGFSGVDFSYVNLKGVDVSCFLLYGANCINTYLDHTLLKIQGSRDLFCGYGGMVKIDCQYHSVDDWLAHGAYTDEYSKSEQKEYKGYLKMYAKIWEGEKVESNTCEQ